MKLMFKDLPSCRGLTDEQKKKHQITDRTGFDLSRLPPTDIRYDFAAFLFDRSSAHSYTSLSNELTNYNNLADFIMSAYPELEHLTDISLPELEKMLKTYLLWKRDPLFYVRKRSDQKGTGTRKNPLFNYLRIAYSYFLPEEEEGFDKHRDIWKLKDLPFPIYASQIQPSTQISFKNIKQLPMKNEIKDAILYELKRKSLSYVFIQLYAVSYLSKFLLENFPEVTSLKDFDRHMLEEYLSYIYLEANRKKNYRSELNGLKKVLTVIGQIHEFNNLRGIFLKSDFQKQDHAIYKSYSDSELSRIHEGYKTLDKQTARLLLIHEFLGLRISDTLTLKIEDVFFGDDPHIDILQPKTGNVYTKKMDQTLSDLLSSSIAETRKTYGDTTFIFVHDKDPTKPMKYETLMYRLRTMSIKLDLRDDNGNPLKITTHLFRHTYGKKLCDLLKDDATIAALLGQKSLSSVSYYRQMSPKVLAETTKAVKDARNEKIKQFKKGWML